MTKDELKKAVELNSKLEQLMKKRDEINNSKGIVNMVQSGCFFSEREKMEHIVSFLARDERIFSIFEEKYTEALEQYGKEVDTEVAEIEKEVAAL